MLVCYKCCMFAAHYKSFNLPDKKFRNLSSIGRASRYFYCSDLRSGIDLRLRILRRRWVRSHAGEQSLYGSCQLLLSPSQTHPVPEVPEAILPVWWTQYQNRSTRSNFCRIASSAQCVLCTVGFPWSKNSPGDASKLPSIRHRFWGIICISPGE